MIADRQMPPVCGDQFGYGQEADRAPEEEFRGSRRSMTQVCWVGGGFCHLPPSMFAGGTKQPFCLSIFITEYRRSALQALIRGQVSNRAKSTGHNQLKAVTKGGA